MSYPAQTIQRYLLGELPESERVALEQAYFNDPRLFDHLVQTENELVDKYARGQLPPATRARFEEYYLGHTNRRERAKFAEALAAKLWPTDEVAAAAPAAAEPWWGRLLLSMRSPKLAWGFSLAVILLMAAVGVWSLIETRRLRQELATTEAERATQEQRERELQQQVTDERVRTEKLSEELERLRGREQITVPSPTLPTKAAPTLASLVLTVGGIRSADSAPPAVLIIPAEAQRVLLQLNLRESNYSNYRAALNSASGAQVFAWSRLTPRTTKSGQTLALDMPARRLSTGDYILTLRGVSKTGELEDVSKSLFRVERK